MYLTARETRSTNGLNLASARSVDQLLAAMRISEHDGRLGVAVSRVQLLRATPGQAQPQLFGDERMKGWSSGAPVQGRSGRGLRAAPRAGQGSVAVTSAFDSSMYQSQKSSQKKW